jgi:predicted metal-binding transcription factor (methanogenesis marker protein 9)
MYIYRVELSEDDYGELYGVNVEYLISDVEYSQDEFKNICDKVFTKEDCVMCDISEKLIKYGFRSLEPQADYWKRSSEY